jgi:hypothetical protein
MNRYFAALAALFVVRLILPISAASAQIALGDVEMPTGDVWPSQEQRIYIPQNALVPNGVDGEANVPPSPEAATPKSKNTSSQHPPNNAVSPPRTDIPSGKNCAPQHALLANAADVRDCLPHKLHRAHRPTDARSRNRHPGA